MVLSCQLGLTYDNSPEHNANQCPISGVNAANHLVHQPESSQPGARVSPVPSQLQSTFLGTGKQSCKDMSAVAWYGVFGPSSPLPAIPLTEKLCK